MFLTKAPGPIQARQDTRRDVVQEWHYPNAGEHAKKHEQASRQLNLIMAALDHAEFGSNGFLWA
jgi:hypothetical protein